MQSWIIEWMERFGYFGTFILILLENLFPPIPSEVILTLGGFMTTYTRMTVVGTILFATLGSLAGAIILYGVGYLFNIGRLEIFAKRWGRFLKIKVEDIHKANAWFHRHGSSTIFYCRMIPMVRSLISIPAGISKMSMLAFLSYTTAGTLIWNTVLVYAGALLGENWGRIVSFMDAYSNVTNVVLVSALTAVGFIWLSKRRKRR